MMTLDSLHAGPFKVDMVGNFDSASFTPFAARTQQFVKEQFGQVDEKVVDVEINTKF